MYTELYLGRAVENNNAWLRVVETKKKKTRVEACERVLPAGGCPAFSRGLSFGPDLDSCCTISFEKFFRR